MTKLENVVVNDVNNVDKSDNVQTIVIKDKKMADKKMDTKKMDTKKMASKDTQPKKRKKTIPMKDFIIAYQKSNSHQEVADILDMSVQNVYTRARAYRTMKINLKEMPRKNGVKINVDEANKIIAELTK